MISIISEAALNLTNESVVYAQATLRIWSILGQFCQVRFSLNDTPPIMLLFEATLKLDINAQSRKLIATCASIALAYG